MTISFVDVSTDTDTNTSFTVTEPTGAGSGDFILAWGSINATDGVWTLPGDMTQIDQFTETVGSTDQRIFICWKTRGADAGSGYTFTYDGTSAVGRVNVAAYSGSTQNPTLDVTYVKGSHYQALSNDPNDAAQPITTNTDGAVVILAYQANGGALTVNGPPTNYNQRGAAVGVINYYLCDRTITSAGTETPGSFDFTGTTQDQKTFTIAIAEISSGATASVVLKRNRSY